MFVGYYLLSYYKENYSLLLHMQIFIHGVGKEGSDRDFPKTVFGDVKIDFIEKNLTEPLKSEITATLSELFPEGHCNCWGVPSGASSIIKKMKAGDAFFLMRTTSKEGEIPALGIVQAFWKEPLPELSNALWGSTIFPYIFFFRTKEINLTWTDFKKHVGYSDRYALRLVSRVKPDNFQSFSDEEALVNFLSGSSNTVSEPNEDFIFGSYVEGDKTRKYVTTYERNPKLKKDALKIHGYICKGCKFSFEKRYGEYGKEFIHVHHLKPISESDGPKKVNPKTDMTVLCPNCHAMVHRYKNKTLTLDELRSLIREDEPNQPEK